MRPARPLVGCDVFRYVEAGAVRVVARVYPEQPVPPPVIRSGRSGENHANTAAINLELRINRVRQALGGGHGVEDCQFGSGGQALGQ